MTKRQIVRIFVFIWHVGLDKRKTKNLQLDTLCRMHTVGYLNKSKNQKYQKDRDIYNCG